MKVPKTGKGVETAARDMGWPSTSLGSIFVRGDRVYWADKYGGALRAAPLAGGSPETVARFSGALTSLTLDDVRAYATSYDPVTRENRLWIASLAGGSPPPAAALATKDRLGAVVREGGFTYVARGGTMIGAMKVSESGGDAELIPLPRVPDAMVALDGVLYWTVVQTEGARSGTVERIDLPTGTIATLASGESLPAELAVDGSKLYWLTSDAVRTSPRTGGAIDSIASGQPQPDHIAVDDDAVYWTNADPTAAGASVWRVAKPR